MTYASIADLRAAIPARDIELLADFEGGDAAAVEARLQNALLDATAEIDGFVARQLKAASGPAPRVLNVICRDLALHRLYRNLGHDSERLKALRADALSWLRDVASGRIDLGDAPGPTRPTSGGVAITDGPVRLLTRDSLRGY